MYELELNIQWRWHHESKRQVGLLNSGNTDSLFGEKIKLDSQLAQCTKVKSSWTNDLM